MFLRICKFLVALVAISSLSAWGQLQVPVQDMILNATLVEQSQMISESIKASGTQITSAINNSMKSNSELANTINEQQIETASKVFAMEQSRRNSEMYQGDFGARTKPACGEFSKSKTMMAGQVSKKNVYKLTQDITRRYLEQNRYASQSEPVNISAANKLMTQFKVIADAESARSEGDKGALVDTTFSGLSTKVDANNNSEYNLAVARNNFLLSPFPDKLSSHYDDTKQSSAVIFDNAVAKVKVERLKEAASVTNRILSNRAMVYDDNWAKQWYSAGQDGIQMKALSFGKDGAQGWYSTLETTNRYRIMNPDWITYTTATATERALSADQNLMFAQLLATNQEMMSLLADLVKMEAFHYALDVEEYGKHDKLSSYPQ